MTEIDIENTIAAFAQASADARRLGFDAIEFHGAHGYLIDQFFWDGTNYRTDRFGGTTLAERTRFAVELLRAVRKTIGPDCPIIFRISQWKQQDFGAKMARTPQEMETWLAPLAEAGADVFHCSQRRFWEPEFNGSDLNFAGWAEKVSGKPTITVGSVGLAGGDFIAANRGESAVPASLEELIRRLERSDFDLVAVGRALLKDPFWVTKIRHGQHGELQGYSKEATQMLF